MNIKTNAIVSSVTSVTPVFYKANRMNSRAPRTEHLTQVKGESFGSNANMQEEHRRRMRNQGKLLVQSDVVQETNVYQDCFNNRVLTGGLVH